MENLNRDFYRNTWTWTKPILGWNWEIWKCRCILVPFTVSKSACFCTYNVFQGVKFRSSVLTEAGGMICKCSAKVNWIFLTAWKDLIASPGGTFFYSVSNWEGLAQSKCWSMDLGKVLIAVSYFKLYYTLTGEKTQFQCYKTLISAYFKTSVVLVPDVFFVLRDTVRIKEHDIDGC